MPSSLHQGLLALFVNAPRMAPDLLRRLGAPLPEFDSVLQVGAELGQPPSERRVDLALELRRAGAPVTALLLEVQLRRDPDKPFTWPLYYAAKRDQLRCDPLLVVLTLHRGVARWCRREIATPQLRFAPLVLGPDEVPAITEAGTATPELAVLAALMHADDDAASAAAVAQAALRGLAPLDIDRTRTYTDLVLQALGPAARHILEAAVIPQNYVFKSDFARKYIAMGRVESIYDILEARGLAIPEELRIMLEDLRTPSRLQSLLRRALTVKRAEDLLPRPRRPRA